MNTFAERLRDERTELLARLAKIENLLIAEETWMEYYRLKREGKL